MDDPLHRCALIAMGLLLMVIEHPDDALIFVGIAVAAMAAVVLWPILRSRR